MTNKLSLEFEEIAVLTATETSVVGGGYPYSPYEDEYGGTLGCSAPCKTTIDSSNCKTTTGHGSDSRCKPTSNGCIGK